MQDNSLKIYILYTSIVHANTDPITRHMHHKLSHSHDLNLSANMLYVGHDEPKYQRRYIDYDLISACIPSLGNCSPKAWEIDFSLQFFSSFYFIENFLVFFNNVFTLKGVQVKIQKGQGNIT